MNEGIYNRQLIAWDTYYGLYISSIEVNGKIPSWFEREYYTTHKFR